MLEGCEIVVALVVNWIFQILCTYLHSYYFLFESYRGEKMNTCVSDIHEAEAHFVLGLT